MPFANYHACRLLDPADFVSFFTKHVKDNQDIGDYKATGKPYDLIIGYREDGSSDPQTNHYDKDTWTAEEAKKHCQAHNGIEFTPAAGANDQLFDEDRCCGANIDLENLDDLEVIMTAIKIHHTATDTESAWDGPGEVAKAPSEEKTLRYMHAWVDENGDPNAKQSYKLPHHAAGADTPANIHGVNNALARLPQSNIPEADKSGVKAHLEAHRKDAGLSVDLDFNRPIRCVEGNAKPYEPFWRWNMVNATGTDGQPAEPEMELYGNISEFSWSGDEITPQMFKEDLYNFGNGGPVTIRMNSYGGDVIAASIMRGIIQDYPGRVTVRIDGIAASAATVVATAGDVVKIQDTAYYMIHDPLALFFMAALNIDQLGSLLDELKAVKTGIINAYESRTKLSRTRIATLMTNETWLAAQEAVELGFADEVIGSKKIKKAQNQSQQVPVAMINALKNYRNVPDELLKRFLPVNMPDMQATKPLTGDQLKAAERLRAEVKLLKKE